MNLDCDVTRRSFLGAAAVASVLPSLHAAGRYPLGLELYSVRGELQKDLRGTVTAVAKMGYQVVEFYSPYYSWTPEYTREVRKLLDDLGIRCFSTHNGAESFAAEGVEHAIELNQILGSRYVVMASPGRVEGADGWKRIAEQLNQAGEKMRPAGQHPGYHNHQMEFRGAEGARPIDIIAQNTGKDVLLQLDVGTCVEAGADPVGWIEKNPGRFPCIHLKDYSPEPGKGYRVLLGEGASPWRRIFEAVEKSGGFEFYLVEQEVSQLPEIEAARLCLENLKKLHG